MSCATGTLNVSSAAYAADGTTESCLSYVTSACAGATSCSLTFSNTNCGGDPFFGVVKSGSASVNCVTPIALIQNSYVTPQNQESSVSVAFTTSQTAGNTDIVAIGWNDITSSISSVQDAQGNTYQVAVPMIRGVDLSQAIYYASGIKAGSNTVTVQFNQPANIVDLRIAEYSGIAETGALDASASLASNSTVADAGPITVSSSNELIFAAGTTDSIFQLPGTGFTTQVITSPDSDIVEYEVAQSSGSYDATALLLQGNWILQTVGFRGQ